MRSNLLMFINFSATVKLYAKCCNVIVMLKYEYMWWVWVFLMLWNCLNILKSTNINQCKSMHLSISIRYELYEHIWILGVDASITFKPCSFGNYRRSTETMFGYVRILQVHVIAGNERPCWSKVTRWYKKSKWSGKIWEVSHSVIRTKSNLVRLDALIFLVLIHSGQTRFWLGMMLDAHVP